MTKHLAFPALLLCALIQSLSAGTTGVRVIYGEDNRVDVFESKNSVFVELARSTAAMIAPANLRSTAAGFQVVSSTLAGRGICSQERFSEQTAAANCSGFLVAPNLLVTAGHCIKSAQDCSSYKWVFDYKAEADAGRPVEVAADQVYSCKRIVERSLDVLTKDDYALIELARDVTDRRPLSFRREGKVAVGASLVVIGHPSGLPTKIADGAQVRSLSGKFFVANLDTYGGNSGSAVFNVDTGEVEGILVRGENDYVYDSSLRCQVSNKCTDDGCRGEDVSYIGNIRALANL